MDQEIDSRFVRYERGRRAPLDGALVREGLVRLHVNGRELATLMCTPLELDWLALGFLCSEGIIRGLEDVRLVKVCPSQTCVDIWLQDADFEPPTQLIITSGCGGGITFNDLSTRLPKLESGVRVTAPQLGRLMGLVQGNRETRGTHTAALADGDRLLVIAEDVGRHNTVDKLWGRCLAEGIETRDRVLLSTGRISSEMLRKAAQMQVPVVASRTSPTDLAVALAEAWHITLAGYVRHDSLNVYAGAERVVGDEEAEDNAIS